MVKPREARSSFAGPSAPIANVDPEADEGDSKIPNEDEMCDIPDEDAEANGEYPTKMRWVRSQMKKMMIRLLTSMIKKTRQRLILLEEED